MYFYDAQGFYNKSKCIEGFFQNFSNSQPPAQQPAQPPAQRSGFFGLPPPSSQPPAQPPARQSGFFGQPLQPPAQQPAQPPAQRSGFFGSPPPSSQPPAQPPAQQSGFFGQPPQPPAQQPAQPPAQQPAQQTLLGGVKANINTPPAQPPAQQQAQQTLLGGVKANINTPPAQPPAQQPAQQTLLGGVKANINTPPPPEEQPVPTSESVPTPEPTPAQAAVPEQTASQETSTTSSTTSQEGTNSSQLRVPLINLNPPIQQASNQNLNNSILSGYVTNLVSSRFNELNKSNEDTNRIVNIKIFTLKDPEVFIINDETKANSYNQESSKIFRVFYKPKLEKSQILIEISSYYDISGTHKDKFECEINVSEDKNHYTDSKGGKRIAIRKIRFEKNIGGGARSGSFFPSGIFKNNNIKPKYFHFNVKREGSDDRFKLARGKNSNFLEVEGLIKIIEIKTN